MSTSPRPTPGTRRGRQRGGFVFGLVVGLLIGVGVSLAVALYVTKVPVPFINKVPQHSPEQDAAQIEKNRDWNPNAALVGKPVVRAASAASGAAAPPPAPAVEAAARPLAGDAAASAARKEAKLAPGTDPFTYFVQAGAYGRPEDAEQQRANLALIGVTAKVTAREQSGRTVYRVRLGPFERKEDAEAGRQRLDAAGIDAALVRVQR